MRLQTKLNEDLHLEDIEMGNGLQLHSKATKLS